MKPILCHSRPCLLILILWVFSVSVSLAGIEDHPTANTLFPSNPQAALGLTLLGNPDYMDAKTQLRQIFPFKEESIDHYGYRKMTFTVPGRDDVFIDVHCDDKGIVYQYDVQFAKPAGGAAPFVALFGSTWDEEVVLVEEAIDNLEPGWMGDAEEHPFINKLEKGELRVLHRDHGDELEVILKYKGDGPLDLQDPGLLKFNDSVVGGGAAGLALLNDPISELIFPNNPDLTWLVYQVGRNDSRELKYEFLERFADAEYTGISLEGWSRSDPNIYVSFSLDTTTEMWTSLWVSAPLKGVSPDYFGMFRQTWATECEAMRRAGRMENIVCEENRHTFTYNSRYEINHAVVEDKETVRVKRTENYDARGGEWNEYALGGDTARVAKFKGPHLEDGTPHGRILAQVPVGAGAVVLELEVDHGKVINPPEPYYQFNITRNSIYQGQLDPETWEPSGIGRYEFDGSTENYTDRITFVGENFEGFRQPDLTRQYFVENALLDTPCPGSMMLWDLEELQIKRGLAFEGMGMVFLDEARQERYVGKFSIVAEGHNRYDDQAYPTGQHLYQKLVDGQWQTVETSVYDIIYGTVQGRNFYGDKAEMGISYSKNYFFCLTHQHQYSDAVKKQFAETTREVFETMLQPGEPIGTQEFWLPTDDYLGYMAKKRTEPTLRPRFELPGFTGSTEFNVHRKKLYRVDYVQVYENTNHDLLVKEANKVAMALLEASEQYFGDDLYAKKYILDSKTNPGRAGRFKMRLDFDAGVQYQFAENREWGPYITMFLYHKEGKGQITVSYRLKFKKASDSEKYN